MVHGSGGPLDPFSGSVRSNYFHDSKKDFSFFLFDFFFFYCVDICTGGTKSMLCKTTGTFTQIKVMTKTILVVILFASIVCN